MLGQTISVPPPIWIDNGFNGPDVAFKEYGENQYYKLYQLIPDNENWDGFSKKMVTIAAVKMNPDKTCPFISYVEEKLFLTWMIMKQ